MTEDPWYVTAFSADYRAVYPHRDLPAARREVDRIVAVGLGPRVLDLCCGFGRHTLAMHERGLDVVGVDLSAELLAQARNLEGGRALTGRLVRADARQLPFRAGSFDGVVSLFSSFGYFGDEGDRSVLAGIARLLVPGGRALLDLMNPDRIRATLVGESTTERAGARLVERRRLVDEGRRVVKEVHLVLPGGIQRRWREEVRMYGCDELAPLVAPMELEVTGVEGDYAGSTFGPDSERQIVFLRRR